MNNSITDNRYQSCNCPVKYKGHIKSKLILSISNNVCDFICEEDILLLSTHLICIKEKKRVDSIKKYFLRIGLEFRVCPPFASHLTHLVRLKRQKRPICLYVQLL